MPTPRTNDDVDRVRDASDIVRVIGEHLALKPKGREYVGLCPFHDDHKPSMCVVPHKQIFHCFSCGAGGDVFTFVQRFLGMEFPEALKFLADRTGVELTPHAAHPASTERSGPSKQDLYAANEFAQRFFRAILDHPEHGRAARDMIERRAISPEMVEAFGIGAAPDRWDGLIEFAASKPGAPDTQTLLAAGLVKAREGASGHYDAMRNRLIFPICDIGARPTAFGGRRLADSEDEGAKYLNSPETPVFNKSRTLYGLAQAARAIQRERTAIIVEGYIDVIACHQAGFDHVVGTLGTALTTEHARLLRGRCDRVVLLFDGDEAGLRAADRACDVLFGLDGLDVSIAVLPADGAKDPDDLLKTEGGAQAFANIVHGAVDLIPFRFARLALRLEGTGAAAAERIVAEELDQLARIGLGQLSPVRRELVVRSLAQAAGVSEGAIRSMTSAGRGAGNTTEQAARQGPARGKAIAAEWLLGCVLVEPRLARTLEDPAQDLARAGAYGSPVVQRVAQALGRVVEGGADPDLTTTIGALGEDSEAIAKAVGLHQTIDRHTDSDSAQVRTRWDDCVARLWADAGAPLTESGERDAFSAAIEALGAKRESVGASRMNKAVFGSTGAGRG